MTYVGAGMYVVVNVISSTVILYCTALHADTHEQVLFVINLTPRSSLVLFISECSFEQLPFKSSVHSRVAIIYSKIPVPFLQ